MILHANKHPTAEAAASLLPLVLLLAARGHPHGGESLLPFTQGPLLFAQSIGTYEEKPSGMTPTTMKIHLDGRTYGLLVASGWTEWGLIIVGIEAFVFIIRRLRK